MSPTPWSTLGRDAEALDADMAADVAIQHEDAQMGSGGIVENEDDVADLFMDDFDDSMFDDPAAPMVEALRMAGVQEDTARTCALTMMSLTPPSTFVEVYGTSIFDHNLMSRRNLNIEGLRSFDLRSLKPDGTPWNFMKRSDRKLARRMINEQDPDWVIGAPPCTAFSIWNHGINFKKMDPETVRQMLEEGRAHLRFACSLYRRQIANGKFFLHEHPATAMSWKEEEVDALARLPFVHLVTAHQCQYGLVTPSDADRSKMVPALKPTKFLTNSLVMSEQLQKKCDGSHSHQHLTGGRCKDAAFYPLPLVRAILKGIALQAALNVRSINSEEEKMKVFAMPLPTTHPVPKEEFGPPHYSSVPKVNGGKMPIVYDESNFKPRYLDEYTGEVLAPHLIRTAIEDELDYFNSKVWQICTMDEMRKVPEYILVRSRWVLCNKGDSQNPDVRARLVSCELNNGEKNDFFSASTPPLEGKRMLFARYVSERTRKGKPLRISFVDIRKAYFNALPERAIFMRVPKELGLPPNTVARQVRCVYGTRDAGKLWEDTYTQVLEGLGFITGVSNPCVFHHPTRDLCIVIHGDDFTALGTDDELNWYEGQLQQSFEIKIRGRLGEGCEGPQEIRILNRVVSVNELGLMYEADPRHCDLLSSSLNLTSDSSAATPGVKPIDRDVDASKSDEPDLPSLLDYSNPDSVISAIVMGKYDSLDPAERTGAFSLENRPSTSEICHSINPVHSSVRGSPPGSQSCHSSISTSVRGSPPGSSSCHSSISTCVRGSPPGTISHSTCAVTSVQASKSRRALTRARRLKNKMSHTHVDQWLSADEGVWMRLHALTRRTLASPSDCADTFTDEHDQDNLSSLRFTIGKHDDGRTFAYSDSWRNSELTNAELRRPWTGITCFFSRHCQHIDEHIARITSIHDVQMRQKKEIRFSDQIETLEVPAYSEAYHSHPHFILATATGWKASPSRSDHFTGKSSNVMASRRLLLAKKFGNSSAKRRRRQLIIRANDSPMDVDNQSPKSNDEALDVPVLWMTTATVMTSPMPWRSIENHQRVAQLHVHHCSQGPISHLRCSHQARGEQQVQEEVGRQDREEA